MILGGAGGCAHIYTLDSGAPYTPDNCAAGFYFEAVIPGYCVVTGVTATGVCWGQAYGLECRKINWALNSPVPPVCNYTENDSGLFKYVMCWDRVGNVDAARTEEVFMFLFGGGSTVATPVATPVVTPVATPGPGIVTTPAIAPSPASPTSSPTRSPPRSIVSKSPPEPSSPSPRSTSTPSPSPTTTSTPKSSARAFGWSATLAVAAAAGCMLLL
jgi:hypothetical protein